MKPLLFSAVPAKASFPLPKEPRDTNQSADSNETIQTLQSVRQRDGGQPCWPLYNWKSSGAPARTDGYYALADALGFYLKNGYPNVDAAVRVFLDLLIPAKVLRVSEKDYLKSLKKAWADAQVERVKKLPLACALSIDACKLILALSVFRLILSILHAVKDLARIEGWIFYILSPGDDRNTFIIEHVGVNLSCN